MPKPIITLTTDFGHQDHFVGVMKGVILGILPEARIVDICHEINAFEVTEAAFTVAQSYRWFPKRTIHVIVVDPGVGSKRRPILVEAAEQYFIAPDNGVLAMVFSREDCQARHITNEKYFLHPVSNTFHGRDVFAPVAGHLGRGVEPSEFGRPIEDHLRPEFENPVRTGKRFWTGSVLKVDRFGNLVTNFRLADFPELRQRGFEMTVGLLGVGRLADSYAEAAPEEPVLIEGSSGYLEVVCNRSSAAKRIGCAAGSPLELRIYPPADPV